MKKTSAYVYDPTYIEPQYKKICVREQRRVLTYGLGKMKNNINI
jgi:hypothetical protein